MGWYRTHVFPAVLDLGCRASPVARQRAQVVPRARGRVLEVGIGTGLNLPFYDVPRIDRLWGLDPAGELHARADQRSWAAGLPVELIQASAESIPLDDASVDTVVMTYVLCSVADPDRALSEIARVLVPGGQLLLCEHGQAPEDGVRRWQDRLTPLWQRIAGGCHLNRPIREFAERSGLATRELQNEYLPSVPWPLGYHYRGRMEAPA